MLKDTRPRCSMYLLRRHWVWSVMSTWFMDVSIAGSWHIVDAQ